MNILQKLYKRHIYMCTHRTTKRIPGKDEMANDQTGEKVLALFSELISLPM